MLNAIVPVLEKNIEEMEFCAEKRSLCKNLEFI
uniref:Uncharacterized protein n=1 Tax=Rhizophora mucronata TaxID=61149 RepID=A0A2P2QU59_RHIMU